MATQQIKCSNCGSYDTSVNMTPLSMVIGLGIATVGWGLLVLIPMYIRDRIGLEEGEKRYICNTCKYKWEQ